MMAVGKYIWIILVVAIIVAGAVGLFLFGGNVEQPGAGSEHLRVVATLFPLYDFARNIGGDKIELDILFSQTPEVSSFQPSDIKKINNADLIVMNGAGLEPVVKDLILASSNANIAVVDTSEGVELLNADPHIWLDPRRAIAQVQNIKNAFIEADPENALLYERNAGRYIGELEALDRELEREIEQFSGKDFISFHPSFRYFANRYGLNQAAVFEEFPGREPSSRQLSRIIEIIKNKGITALFSEPQFSPKVIEVIAEDLGLEVRTLNPIETGDPEQDSYISLTRANLQTLKDVLQ